MKISNVNEETIAKISSESHFVAMGEIHQFPEDLAFKPKEPEDRNTKGTDIKGSQSMSALSLASQVEKGLP